MFKTETDFGLLIAVVKIMIRFVLSLTLILTLHAAAAPLCQQILSGLERTGVSTAKIQLDSASKNLLGEFVRQAQVEGYSQLYWEISKQSQDIISLATASGFEKTVEVHRSNPDILIFRKTFEVTPAQHRLRTREAKAEYFNKLHQLLLKNKDRLREILLQVETERGADYELRQVEDLLKQGLDAAKSKSGSIVIMDPNTGAVKATANYPTFNPAAYADQTDISVFSNAAFSSPLEPGSVIKPFTAAAALEQGVVSMNSSYYDPSFYKIDDATVRNIEEDGGPGTKNVSDILQLSLNTGATWLLQQMGGGDLNLKGRTAWHDYMVNHYRFGQITGIESYETEGIIPDPAKGDGLNIQYANTSFGQGMTVTPLQLAAALSALINGGTYYQPYMVESVTYPDGTSDSKKPKIVRQNVISSSVSEQIRGLMQYVVDKNNRPAVRAGFQVGGKTGTAQIPKPTGGYYEDKYNGMYVGFVGGDRPQYAIVVRVNEPGIAGYAGSRAAGPIFTSVSNLLINNFGVTPKTQP